MEDIFTDQRIIQEYRRTYYDAKSHHDIRCLFTGDRYVGSFISRGPLEKRSWETVLLDDATLQRVTKQAQKLLYKT